MSGLIERRPRATINALIAGLCLFTAPQIGCATTPASVRSLERKASDIKQLGRTATELIDKAELGRRLDRVYALRGQWQEQLAHVRRLRLHVQQLRNPRGRHQAHPHRRRLDLSGDLLIGAADAPVQVLLACTFDQRYCRDAKDVLVQLKREYAPHLAFAMHYFNTSSDRGARAAKAMCAAAEQGATDDMFYALWVSLWSDKASSRYSFDYHKNTDDEVRRLAGEIGLDVAAFDRAYMGGRCQQRIADTDLALIQAGIERAPSFVVNGRVLAGGQTPARLRALIDEELVFALGERD